MLPTFMEFMIERHPVFYEVTQWIHESFSFDYDVHDLSKLQEISNGFAKFSGHALEGCIGAIDGLALHFRCPAERDGVSDPGNYYCHKGFHALNVQAVVNSRKKFLFASPSHVGNANDARAWSETPLSDVLEEIEEVLLQHRLWLAGDSAYPLRTFLMTPYPKSNFQTVGTQTAGSGWNVRSVSLSCDGDYSGES